MLVIRNAQMSALAAASEQDFRGRLETALRHHHAARLDALGPGGAEMLTDRAIAAARAHGMTWESSIAVLAGLMLDIGQEVHRHPRVAAVLADSLLSPDSRVHALFERITAQEWNEIASTLPSATRTA